jgi:hypothetical protein
MEASSRWKTDTEPRVCGKTNPIHILAQTERKAENKLCPSNTTVFFVFNRFITPDGFRTSRLLSRGLYFDNFEA